MQALPPPRASPGVTLCLSLSVSVTVATRRGASLCVGVYPCAWASVGRSRAQRARTGKRGVCVQVGERFMPTVYCT